MENATPTAIITALTEEARLNLTHYRRRVESFGSFRDMFVAKILEHNPNFPLTKEQLEILPYEDLAELAPAVYDRTLHITLGAGQDYLNGIDKKSAIGKFRNNDIERGSWTHSYCIRGVKGKNAGIMATCYNQVLNEFEYFYFPKGSFSTTMVSIEIIIERYTSRTEPKWTGKCANKYWKWWEYKCDNFEDMVDRAKQDAATY